MIYINNGASLSIKKKKIRSSYLNAVLWKVGLEREHLSGVDVRVVCFFKGLLQFLELETRKGSPVSPLLPFRRKLVHLPVAIVIRGVAMSTSRSARPVPRRVHPVMGIGRCMDSMMTIAQPMARFRHHGLSVDRMSAFRLTVHWMPVLSLPLDGMSMLCVDRVPAFRLSMHGVPLRLTV